MRRQLTGTLIVVVLAGAVSAAAPAPPASPSNDDCQACHSEGPTAPAVLAQSVHHALACVDCHADLATITEFPHADTLKAVDCGTCHHDAITQYRDSIHDEGRTRLVIHDRYPSKEALDEVIAAGASNWNPETFDQLDELLVTLGTSKGR